MKSGEGILEGEGRAVVRWDMFLPRPFVRVLLVEGDNSTREIVSALLRKCGYRVSVAADGVKAWETLKRKGHEIDLVLSEVDLPRRSGFCLLTMIMEHESCKNIPVIMMSSNDNISMVFNYMQTGAADFLVKPVRKNELRNLWQHVWRRCIPNLDSGDRDLNKDLKLSQQKYKNNTDKSASIHSSENPVCSKRKVECSDKGSDTQTSCTRQSMEAQSTYLQSAEQNKMNLTGNNSKEVLVLHDDTEAEGKPMGSTAEVSSFNQTNEAHTLGGNSANNEINCPNRISSLRFNDYHQTEGCNLYKMKPSVQVADLLGAMDSKTKRILILENDTNIFDGTMDNPSSVIDDSDQLQLSLKRYQPSSNCIEIESSRCKRLSHSNSSAFSWYSSSKVLQSRNLPNPTCTPRPEATESTMISSSQDRISVQHSYDNALAHFPYSQRPTTIQKSASTNSNHSIPRTNDLDPSEETEKIYQNENAELQNLESTEDPKNIPSSTAYCNRSGSVCNGRDDAKGSGIAYEDGMHTKDGNRATKESDNDNIFQSREVILPTRPNRSIEREAALLKFRLKRKERCFGKKVRYHSRQKLAEQRPRVKGQFVRQVQSVETKANING